MNSKRGIKMFALVNGEIYRYEEFRGEVYLLTFDYNKACDGFKPFKHGSFKKNVTLSDCTITDVYSLKYYVEYMDSYIKDTKEWYLYEDNQSDRPYSIDKDEICLNVFGSCDEGGWKSLGREDSYKIISLSDCSAFFVDYIYKKREGEILDKQITQRCAVSKEEFVRLVKLSRYNAV